GKESSDARIVATASRLSFRSPRARRHFERLSRFQILDHGAEINRLRIKSLVFGDLGPVQNFKAVTFKHLFTAPAFEGNDLAINAFLPAAVKVTQIRAHQGARG